jgi:hypothetical protein
MTYTLHKSQLRTLRQDDPNFMIRDGIVRAPRASFHILPECPREYRMIILECINNGWLKPVAHITEREYIFMGLNAD